MTENEIGYPFFKSEFSRKIDFNVSEEYMKARIFTQTASLFYDQLDPELITPGLFQNYSHCFLGPTKPANLSIEKYRSITGYGNNLDNPKKGEKFTSYGRILKAAYDDQVYSIRKSGRGYDLPTARNIARKLFLNDKSNLNKFEGRIKIPNVLFLMFGQMIKHDTGSRQFNKNIDGDKKIGEQVNAVTSYLDLSVIYGSSHKQMRMIRSYNGGRLKMNPSNVLPTQFLTVVHSLFIRNHNNLSDKLAGINPNWNEEKLFQEARKLNIAIYQKIIYEEWLPILIGKDMSRLLEFTTYNVNADASTLNEFSNSVFRLFHSFIPSEFEIRDRSDNTTKISVSDALKAQPLGNCLENILRGMLHQNISLTGYSDEILNKLFKNSNDVGLDLLSMDILRGRDHGIPAYYRYRKFCNVMPWKLEVFNDLAPHISKTAINMLRQTYKTVYDIDLLVGGALEMIENASHKNIDDLPLIGPTFQCIMYEQFYRWKAGDYYFYSHDGGFSADQLKSIKDYKLANFICDNSDISSVLKNAFISSGMDVDCQSLPSIDLSFWEDTNSNTGE
ncbi:salivary peroxidase/catechol oxidase-like [Chironomus tepperi]|uniref:salivary peroxidase/catechol oxidase-like n=1 Tax=Chironomus tepperi TaxID=113505 RepID=UPI00391F3014